MPGTLLFRGILVSSLVLMYWLSDLMMLCAVVNVKIVFRVGYMPILFLYHDFLALEKPHSPKRIISKSMLHLIVIESALCKLAIPLTIRMLLSMYYT